MNGVSCTTLQKRVITGDSGKSVKLTWKLQEQTQTFVEVPPSAIHSVNMTSDA